MMDFNVQIEKLIEIECLDSADRHSHGVAKVVTHVMVFDECRILGEDWAFFRILNVALERHQALTASLVEKVVHHLQGIKIALLGESRTLEYAHDSAHDLFQNVEGVGD